jgi:hypothetical protein
MQLIGDRLRGQGASEKPRGGLRAVVSKDEFVEVRLELGLAHSVIGPDQPLLKVADSPVSQWDSGLRAVS